MPKHHPPHAKAIIIRPIERGDTPAVARLMRELAAHHGDKALVTARSFTIYCLGSKKIASAIVAIVDKKPVGFALYYDCMSFVAGNITRKLDLLCISKPYRGLGIGYALMRAIAQSCQKDKVARLHIEAHAGNEDAISFYKKLGLKGETKHRIRFVADKRHFHKIEKQRKQK